MNDNQEQRTVALDGTETEIVRLSLGEFGPLGDTFAKFEDGEINVFGGIPGEEVTCRILRYRRKRKPVISGIVTSVLKSSPHRIAPPCPFFGPCSGCQWQHIEYNHQLNLKRESVQSAIEQYDALRSICVSDTIPSDQQFGYRNHARFTVRREGSLGFVNRLTRRFVRIEECMLMASWINETVKQLQDKSGATSQLSMRYGINTGDFLIQPNLSINEINLETGQPYYTERLLGKTFQIASPSFFQVNTNQAEKLITLVKHNLALTGKEVVVDAYAGVGTFAALIASDASHVIAVEESAAAIKDAKVNTSAITNIEFALGKIEDIVKEFTEKPDAAILDPPRSGCQPQVLEAIAHWAPSRVCYVSCDPLSLARDLDTLVRKNFVVENIIPIDMFPQTHHVECVATLTTR